MNPSTHNFENDITNPKIFCCPFCAASAHLTWVGLNPVMYGVVCRNCGISSKTIHTRVQDAVRVWNRRSGLATMGGRATRGNRSKRKLAAAKRNLKRAREQKKLKWIMNRCEAIYWQLKPFREAEIAEAEAGMAEDLARLKEKEPLILAYPDTRDLYEFLLSRRAAAAAAEAEQVKPQVGADGYVYVVN